MSQVVLHFHSSYDPGSATSKVTANKPPELYLPTQAASRDEHIRLPEPRSHTAADHQPAANRHRRSRAAALLKLGRAVRTLCGFSRHR